MGSEMCIRDRFHDGRLDGLHGVSPAGVVLVGVVLHEALDLTSTTHVDGDTPVIVILKDGSSISVPQLGNENNDINYLCQNTATMEAFHRRLGQRGGDGPSRKLTGATSLRLKILSTNIQHL